MPTRKLPRHAASPAQQAFYRYLIARRVDPDLAMLKLAVLNGQREDKDDPRDIGPHRAKRQHKPHRPIGPLTYDMAANTDHDRPREPPADTHSPRPIRGTKRTSTACWI